MKSHTSLAVVISVFVLLVPSIGAGLCVDYLDYGPLSRVAMPGTSDDVAVLGDFAVIADGEAGVGFVDIADPSAPQLVATVPAEGYVSGVTVNGNFVYAALGADGIMVIDASDPHDPMAVDAFDPGCTYRMALKGDLVYAAGCGLGLLVYDVSDPATMEPVSQLELPTGALDVVIDRSHAYVTSFDAGIHVVDLSRPREPELVATLEAYSCGGLLVRGDFLFASTPFSLMVFDIGDPENPDLVASFPEMGGMGLKCGWGTLALADHGPEALMVVDLADPWAPRAVTQLYLPGGWTRASDIILGEVAVVAGRAGGVYFYDLSGLPPYPRLGHLPSNDEVYCVDTDGNRACIGDQAGNVTLVDCSDPEALTPVGSLNIGERAVKVALEGNHAYVLDRLGQLVTVDFSLPSAPQIVHSLTLDYYGGPMDMDAANGSLVIGLSSDIDFLSLDDPTTPQITQTVNTADLVLGVTVSGSKALVAMTETFSEAGWLRVYDLGESHSPELLVEYSMAQSPVDVAAHGDTAYCLATRQVTALDISDPAEPLVLGQRDLAQDGNELLLHGSTLAVAHVSWNSVRLLDCSDPGNMDSIYSITFDDDPVALAAADRSFLVAGAQAGLLSLAYPCDEVTPVQEQRVSLASDRWSLSTHPNPFNPSTKVSFDLEGPSMVQLAVHDLRGRLVKKLIDGARLEPGRHEVEWHGGNEGGAPLASGVYLIRLQIGAESVTRRVALLK